MCCTGYELCVVCDSNVKVIYVCMWSVDYCVTHMEKFDTQLLENSVYYIYENYVMCKSCFERPETVEAFAKITDIIETRGSLFSGTVQECSISSALDIATITTNRFYSDIQVKM